MPLFNRVTREAKTRSLRFCHKSPHAGLLNSQVRGKLKSPLWTAIPFLVLFMFGWADFPLFCQAPRQPYRWLFDVPVPMRDGVNLAADVYLPSTKGRYPVLLDRTPYGKSSGRGEGIYFARHGYAVVVEDTRGRYDSGGKWYAFAHEPDDGQDTIAWAARQPWSNGKVVTIGASYNGIDQWLAAKRDNPALAGMIIGFAPSGLYTNGIYQDGTFRLGFLAWSVKTGRHVSSRQVASLPWLSLISSLPLESIAPGGFQAKFFRDWINHPNRDAYWQALSWKNIYSKLNIPVFLYGGWYDIFQMGTIENFLGIDHKSSPSARSAERLVEGPWGHGALGPRIGKVNFGPQTVVNLHAKELRWLDHYIRGLNNGAENDPRVQIFVMGRNQWEYEKNWPPSNIRWTKYFFHSQGHANTLNGDGTLSIDSPKNDEPDHYTYNPANPVPAHGGGNSPKTKPVIWGAMDQRAVEARKDVLVYTSDPLPYDCEVAGPITVHLFASSSARDTDWTAKLVDVAPDGFAMNLTDGILRARYRHSFAHPELLQPGRVYEYTIKAGYTDNVFLKGHRIRLEISSSDFFQFSRNTNTGNQPEKDSQFVPARQAVYHDRTRASYLLLPLVPRHETADAQGANSQPRCNRCQAAY